MMVLVMVMVIGMAIGIVTAIVIVYFLASLGYVGFCCRMPVPFTTRACTR